jgi:hypothetical protein
VATAIGSGKALDPQLISDFDVATN